MENSIQFARRIATIQPSFIREILKAADNDSVISFAGGLPNAEYFPDQALAELASNIMTERPQDVLQYGQTEGEIELRQHISDQYRLRHQIDVPVENILITNGSQQAFDLIGKVLLDEGDRVIIESPGYLGAIQSLMIYQPQFLPVAIEQNGLNLDAFETALSANPKLVYSVPNFQNPTGFSYDAETRETMASQIRNRPCLIIEDDPYGDIRFEGQPAPSFYHYLPEQTLLLGSFSKIIAPGLRVGWMVAPPAIMQKLIIAKQAADLHTSRLSQHLILAFLRDDRFEPHLQRLCNAYDQRCQLMGDKLDELFGSDVRRSRPQGGMFMWLEFAKQFDTMELFREASELGVVFVPGQPFYTDQDSNHCARLNFSCSSLNQIDQGLALLHQAYQKTT